MSPKLPDLPGDKPKLPKSDSANNSINGVNKDIAGQAKDVASQTLKDSATNPAMIKANLAKNATNAALQNNEQAQKAMEVAEKAQKASFIASKVSALVTKIVGAIFNPVTLALLIVGAFILITISSVQVVGRNENADGCGVGDSVAASIGPMDEGGDWTQRANVMANWLMTNDFDFLGGKPFTKAQAVGVVSNYIQESEVKFAQAEIKGPNSDNSMNKMSNEEADRFTKDYAPAGLGLAQWTWNPGRAGDLIKLAKSMDKQWYEPEVQLNLMKNELEASYGKQLVKKGFSDPNKSVEDLSTIFHDVYEISADPNMNKRHEAARAFMSKFTGGDGMSSGGSCLMSGNFDASGAVALAISISYKTTPESRVEAGDPEGKRKAPEAYKKAKAEAEKKGGADPWKDLYASCDRFVATVIKNTTDKDLPWGATAEQYNYLNGSSKWKRYDKKSQAKPGDVWVTTINGPKGHIILYIGDYNGVDSISHASYGSRVAGIQPSNYVNENMVDTGGRKYAGFTFVGS